MYLILRISADRAVKSEKVGKFLNAHNFFVGRAFRNTAVPACQSARAFDRVGALLDLVFDLFFDFAGGLLSQRLTLVSLSIVAGRGWRKRRIVMTSRRDRDRESPLSLNLEVSV